METHPLNKTTDQNINTIFNELKTATNPTRQHELLAIIKDILGVTYLDVIPLVLHFNPVLELPPDDREALFFRQRLNELSITKQLARDTPGKRICVYCLPKSGSSFTNSAIMAALGCKFVLLTSHATDASSLGMNGREQEMDELAILYAILWSQGSFVAQHHTRCTPFLCHQLRYFGIQPIVTIRNLFDAMLSADEMFLTWKKDGADWSGEAPFALPLDYARLDAADRMTLLANTFGIWGINFYLSWKRCEQAGFVKPLWLTYEDDISNKTRFGQRITDYLDMDEEQSQRLAAYTANPDKKRSRLNVGTVGRGSNIPEVARAIVIKHANLFRDELQEGGFRVLFGDSLR
jgi:hypothetical protein